MTVLIVAHWEAAPGNEPEVRAIVRDLAEATSREPGCLSFEVLEASERPGVFVLLERYAGEDARQDHLRGPHFAELVEGRAVPLLARRVVEAYDVLFREG